MNLLVDMFACQTHSRMRGIGRYTLSLTLELARLRGDHDLTLLADALYPETFDALRRQFLPLLPAGTFLPYYHEPLKSAPLQSAATYRQIAEVLIDQAYDMVAPDVVLTPSLFDSWADGEDGRVALPDKEAGHRRAVILYDLIPYVFREVYLDPDPYISRWYLNRMEMLKKFDMVLAISEATRQDALSILGLDPDRVVNIGGAASFHFDKLDPAGFRREHWLERHGISRPFVLFIGGNDYRKNMDGALRAFAGLPREITSTHQLVLNDVGDESAFRTRARSLGLDDTDLVVFRRYSDEDLGALYSLCKLFIFPSLYEGFGMPVLEAMAAGAPVIAGNNSSLPEVVGRADALFDSSSQESTTALMHKALTDDGFRSDLAAYGPGRAKQFTWERSARRAWDALTQIGAPRGARSLAAAASTPDRRLRLAHVSPLPPQESGVAEYSAELIPHLARHFDIELFTEDNLQVSDARLAGKYPIHPWAGLLQQRDDFDIALYHMGNSGFHIPMLPLLEEFPGVVISHDFFLSNLPFLREARDGEMDAFRAEMEHCHGLRGVADYVSSDINAARSTWPMNWRVLRSAQAVVVHSQHQLALLRHFYGNGWMPAPTVIKHLRAAGPAAEPGRREALRHELGLAPDAFVICSFGFLDPAKLNEVTIQAFAEAVSTIGPETSLVFVGELDAGSAYGKLLGSLMRDPRLRDKVRITGFVDRDLYQKYLRCADAAVQLRAHSRGETSGAVLDCLAFGIPTILNSHGSLNEYDPGAVIKLAEIPLPDELAAAFIQLHRDAGLRRQLSDGARALIVGEHSPKAAADALAEVIVRCAKTSERQRFAPLIGALADLGSPENLLASTSKFAAAHLGLRTQPRLLIDVTALAEDTLDQHAKESSLAFIRDLFSATGESRHIDVVYARHGRLLRASRVAETVLSLQQLSLGAEVQLTVQPGDCLLMLGWLPHDMAPWLEILGALRQRGGRLILLSDPSAAEWSPFALEADAVLCGSRAAAEGFCQVLGSQITDMPHAVDAFFPDSQTGKVSTASDSASPPASALVPLILAALDGRLSQAPWSLLTATTQVTESEAPATGHVRVMVEGEPLPALTREVSLPGSTTFSITVAQDASDGISAALLARTYELPHHYHMLTDLVAPGGTVLDLGAHIGTFSLFAAANGYRVVSVEASPYNAALLQKSSAINGFSALRLVHAAVTDHSGSLMFFEDGPRGAIANPVMTNFRSVSVPAVTVDSIVDSMDLHALDLIKMDIEGSEVAAVRGMPKLLSGPDAPAVLFESNGHTLAFFGMTAIDLRSALMSVGYSCYHLFGGRLYLLAADDPQFECVADCLAVKRLPQGFEEKWKIAPPMSMEDQITVALAEVASANPDVRVYIGRTLQFAGAAMLQDSRIARALAQLQSDSEEKVRQAVAWWHSPARP